MKELVSPHLDDVVYSCWHQLDEQAHVTTVFTGFPPDEKPSDWDISTGFVNSREAFEARKGENRAALLPTFATTTDADLLDVMYRDNNVDYLPETIQAVLANISLADKVYFPLGFSFNYLHPDHVILREVGKVLLHQGVDVSFYADLPYCVAPDRTERWPENLSHDTLSHILGGHAHIEPVHLSRAQAAAKFAAVRKYTSQFDRNDSLSGFVLSDESTYEWEAIVKVT